MSKSPRNKYVYLNTVHAHGKTFMFLSYSRNTASLYHKLHGGMIHRLSYGYFKDCGKTMDGPTFRTVGDPVEPAKHTRPIPVDAIYSSQEIPRV